MSWFWTHTVRLSYESECREKFLEQLNAQQRGGIGKHETSQQRGTSSNQFARSGYRQRGRGTRGSDDNDEGHQSAENKEAFSTSVAIRSANTEYGNLNENKIKLILDSGCTNYVINNENYFIDVIMLKEPINVKVGHGKI